MPDRRSGEQQGGQGRGGLERHDGIDQAQAIEPNRRLQLGSLVAVVHELRQLVNVKGD